MIHFDVKSRYQNPDKFVKKLKVQLRRQQQANKTLRKNEGVWLHNLDCSQTNDIWGTAYDSLVPGNKIVAICKVEGVKLYIEDGRRAGKIDVTVKELRKI